MARTQLGGVLNKETLGAREGRGGAEEGADKIPEGGSHAGSEDDRSSTQLVSIDSSAGSSTQLLSIDSSAQQRSFPKWVAPLISAMRAQGRHVDAEVRPPLEEVEEAAATEEEEEDRKTACAALREFFSLPPAAVCNVLNGGKALKAPLQLCLETIGSSKCRSCLDLLNLFGVLGLPCPAPRRHSVLTAATQRFRKAAAAPARHNNDSDQTRYVRLLTARRRLHYYASLLEKARPPQAGLIMPAPVAADEEELCGKCNLLPSCLLPGMREECEELLSRELCESKRWLAQLLRRRSPPSFAQAIQRNKPSRMLC